MLTVHHLGVSQSDRVVWLCEELGLDYDLKVYQRDPVTRHAPPEYRVLHPAGTAPIITDDDGLALAESGAILEYIDAIYGGGQFSVGKDEPGFADYLHWLHFAGGSIMATGAVTMMCKEAQVDRAEVGLAETMHEREDRQYAWIESWIGSHEYFAAGRFTLADIMMFFPIATMRMNTGRGLEPYPGIRGYLQRIIARPAYLRALELGDPGMQPLVV
ncbi:MAG: glutathione S-transferase family protein [Novosphingobium sp.]